MRLIASVQLDSKKDRDILVGKIELMGYKPKVKGRTVTVVADGHFTGTFISLIGTMDGHEFIQENRKKESIEENTQSDNTDTILH